MPPDGFSGGERMAATLSKIAQKLSGDPKVSVGFLEDAKYTDGTSIASVAALQEFGGTWQMPEREQSIFRQLKKNGEFAKGGKFVKRKVANVETTHHVDAHSITIPPRPFFRRMIAAKKPEWGPALGGALKAKNYDATAALDLVGATIVGQLQESINTLVDPPLAKSTIAAKGFDKPLIATGDMLRAASHEVTS